MKFLAGLFATCLIAAPVCAQPPSPASEGAAEKPAETQAPEGGADSAAPAADKPASAPEPETSPPGDTPVKPAATEAPNPAG